MFGAMRDIFTVRAGFEIPTHVTSNRALDRVEALLCAEHVEVQRTADLVESVHTPLPFLNIDPRNYSTRNWVGINPFVFLDAIAVSYRSTPSTSGRIEVVMSRATAAAWFLFAVAMAALIAARVSVVPIGIGFAVVFVVVSYIYLFHLPPKLAMRELETAVSEEKNDTSPNKIVSGPQDAGQLYFKIFAVAVIVAGCLLVVFSS